MSQNRWKLTMAITFANALACAHPAKADIIKCSYTEPFITTVYSTAENTLTITDAAAHQTTKLTNISFQILKRNTFELWNAAKIVVQRMELNLKGSDGMSDTLYPYDATFIPKDLRGGCTSNHLH